MITFNRLKLLCDDPEKIADAVAAVPSDIIQLSEDKKRIRRNISNSLPENSLEYWQKIKNRTVYMVCLMFPYIIINFLTDFSRVFPKIIILNSERISCWYEFGRNYEVRISVRKYGERSNATHKNGTNFQGKRKKWISPEETRSFF